MNGTNRTWWRTLTILNTNILLGYGLAFFSCKNFELLSYSSSVLWWKLTEFSTLFWNYYEDCTYSQAISPTIKSECDNIHFEQNLLKSYIKSNIEKNLISNGMFIKKSKKEYTTNDCKILKLQNMASVTESRFCMVVSYSLHEKHKGQI